MIGAIIGDIVGSRFEFNNAKDSRFELFTDSCDFTDDTICTVAVADALLKGKPFKECLLDWCRRYPDPMGAYGGSFARWLMANEPQPYNSFGNGSAMRVSPVGWWYNSLEEVLSAAKETALPTHNHPDGIKGAQAVAHAIYHFRKGNNLETFRPLANLYYPGCLNQRYVRRRFDETCQGTVPLCFYLLTQSNGFEDAIRRAVAFGGDSDTIGAIVGSMAEPLWGVPDEIRTKAMGYLPQEIMDVLNTFNFIAI